MTNFFKKNILSLAILLVGISLFTIARLKTPKTTFTITAQEMLDSLGTFDHVTNYQAKSMQADTNAYVFVDLRSPQHFEVIHIDNAINIPIADLLNEANLSLFKTYLNSEKTVVLYAQKERESISPWLLLQEIGMKNTRILFGGFDCFVEETEDCPTTNARYDYAKIASSGGEKEVEVKKVKKVKPAPKTKTKKEIPLEKKAKVEDEGGC